MSGDSGSGAFPAQDLQTNPQPGLEAPVSGPGAEPAIPGAAGVEEPKAAETLGGETISPGAWVTTDSTCKYLGRFQGKKGKRFILAWYHKPSKKWCPNPKLTDGVYRCLTEEEVRERFPSALEAWGASQAATPEPALHPSSKMNTPPVTGIVPQHIDPLSSAQSAA
jgi:hypothetical protein